MNLAVDAINANSNAISQLNTDMALKTATGTGVNVHYNDILVILGFNATGITAQNDSLVDTIVLPEGVSAVAGSPVYLTMPLMTADWRPSGETAYVSFANYPKSPRMRFSVNEVSNAIIVGSFAFPRRYFNITE